MNFGLATAPSADIPAVAVVTAPFAPIAVALNTVPDDPVVVVPHPFRSLDETAVRVQADATLVRIKGLLLGGGEGTE